MNKKMVLVVLIVVILIIMISLIIYLKSTKGIFSTTEKNSNDITYEKNNENIINKEINHSITYKIHDKYDLGSFNHSKRGYYVDTYKMENSPWFYIINMGRQYTGGFSIEIAEVKINENNEVEVIVKENVPKDDESVVMAITHPSVCLELSKKPTSIKIINTEGEIFEALN